MAQPTTTSTRTFMSPPPDKPKAKKPKKSRQLPSLNRQRLQWLVIIFLVAISLFLYGQYREAKDKLQTTNPTANTKQVTNITERVGKLIILPSNETPTIVTVKDASKLKGEQFYVAAKDGDVTLVYSKQHKAILYRPSQNIIVNVANVTVTPTQN